jgi:hypothetical protein
MRKLFFLCIVIAPGLWAQSIQNLAPRNVMVTTASGSAVTYEASFDSCVNIASWANATMRPFKAYFTVGASSNRALLVIENPLNSPHYVRADSITWKGSKLAKIDSVLYRSSQARETLTASLLLNPSSGSDTVRLYYGLTSDNTQAVNVGFMVASFYNVNQGGGASTYAVTDTNETGNNDTSPLHLNVTCAANQLVAAVWGGVWTAPSVPIDSVNATQTKRVYKNLSGTAAGDNFFQALATAPGRGPVQLLRYHTVGGGNYWQGFQAILLKP